MLLCEWQLVTHSLWCLWLLTDTCSTDTVITQSQCLSHSLLSFPKRLVSLSWGVGPHCVCLVRVPYIRTRTSQSHSRVLSLVSAASVSLSLCGLSRQRSLSSRASPSLSSSLSSSSPSRLSSSSLLSTALLSFPLSYG